MIKPNEDEVAEVFNEFFVDKMKTLKDNIDQSIVEDPLETLNCKKQTKNLLFNKTNADYETRLLLWLALIFVTYYKSLWALVNVWNSVK